MNLKLISAALAITLVQSVPFYNQRESLFIDNDTPLIRLGSYFQSHPTLFGLISNKSRSEAQGGYLCYAEEYKDFVEKCSRA